MERLHTELRAEKVVAPHLPSRRGRILCAGVLGLALLLAAGALIGLCAAPGRAAGANGAGACDDATYTVGRFAPTFAQPHPQLPDANALRDVEVALGRDGSAYTAPTEGAPSDRLPLGRLTADGARAFRGSAVRAINEALVAHLERSGLAGVYVTPHPQDIDPRTCADLRPQGATDLRLVVHYSVVTRMRTIAIGRNVPENQRINQTRHSHILALSPIQPADPNTPPEARKDLFRSTALEAYAARLTRAGYNRVEVVAVPPANRPGEMYVDFLVGDATAPAAADLVETVRPERVEAPVSVDLAAAPVAEPVAPAPAPAPVIEPAPAPLPPLPAPTEAAPTEVAQGPAPDDLSELDAALTPATTPTDTTPAPRPIETPAPPVTVPAPVVEPVAPETIVETPVEPAPATEAPAPATETVVAPPPAPAPEATEAVVAVPPAPAPEAAETPIDDGPVFVIRSFDVDYARPHPTHPPIGPLLEREIRLGRTESGYVGPRPGVATTTIWLSELPVLEEQRFHATAIRAVNEAIVEHFNDLGLIGVYVLPDPNDIDARTLEDRRPAGDESLGLLVWTGRVTQLRTVATGERVKGDRRILSAGELSADGTDWWKVDRVHRHILEQSPIQPADVDLGRSLLWRQSLDDYVYLLNRHPGRRVDAALSATGTQGEVNLDYLVNESKPWTVYAQIMNTGTESTGEWRQRFGVIDYQLTGRDDIASLDYVTSCFNETHAVIASYEARVGEWDRLRWRAFGSWSQYTASEVGVQDDRFEGEDWTLGAELIWNVYQYRDFFVDWVVGGHWRHILVDNQTALLKGEDDFFLWNTGVRIERITDVARTTGSLMVEVNCPGIAGTDTAEIQQFAREDVDQDWCVWKWDLLHSTYLEPLLFGEEYLTGGAGEEGRRPVLAHEIAVWTRGQYARGWRLIPQEQQVVGGLYTIRGYPESASAGDTVILGTAEYRYHVPRAFAIRRESTRILGRPFRVAPGTYEQPDWDLIGRVFCDVGRTLNTSRKSYENNETLVSWGVGLELQILQNFNIRCDWGQALRGIESDDVDAGDSEFHIVGTILW